MKSLPLTLGALVLGALSTHAALADTFTFDFSGLLYSGSGTLTATEVGSTNQYDVSAASGTITPTIGPSTSITGLSGFEGADNEVFDPGIYGIYSIDSNGISFTLANGNKVNLSSGFLTYYADSNLPFTTEIITFDVDKTSGSPSPVPEPGSLALLGTGVLGAAGAIRRRLKA